MAGQNLGTPAKCLALTHPLYVLPLRMVVVWDVSAVWVGGLDDNHVEERPVGASSLCELHDVPAILTRTTKAWWHIILCKRIHGSGTVDS